MATSSAEAAWAVSVISQQTEASTAAQTASESKTLVAAGESSVILTAPPPSVSLLKHLLKVQGV